MRIWCRTIPMYRKLLAQEGIQMPPTDSPTFPKQKTLRDFARFAAINHVGGDVPESLPARNHRGESGD